MTGCDAVPKDFEGSNRDPLLNHYAHAMRQDEEDLSFDLGGTRPRHRATASISRESEESEVAKYPTYQHEMARPARLERATLSSAS